MTISTLIATYFTVIFVLFVLLKIYEKYSEKKLLFNKRNIISFIIMTILYFLHNFIPSYLKIVISYFLACIMFKLIYNDDIKTTLYYAFIIMISLFVLDLSFAMFLPVWIKNVEMFNQSLFFKVGYSVFVNIILYIIIANKFVVNFFKYIKETSKSYKFFYIISIIALIVCNIWSFLSSNATSNKPLHIILTLTELVIIISITLNFKIKSSQNLLIIKEQQLKQNLSLYSKVAMEYKELKHNLMNDFLAIKTKINKKDQIFINEIINKYKSNYEWVSVITDIPEGLQGLIFLKKHQAELNKITFNIEYNITKNIEKELNLNNNFKLYEALGILFDNAIEAASESKEKVINTVFTYNQNSLTISIYNTFNNAIDLDKIGDKNYSTKNRGSGIGLNYIRKQKNKFKILQSIQDNIFITNIVLNVKEKK